MNIKPIVMRTIKEIADTVCKVRGIDPEELKRKTRKQEIREARQIAMYFALLEGHSQSKAAGYFGLDHATAIHARKVVAEHMEWERNFRLDIAIIHKKLNEVENEQLAYLSSIEKIAV